MLGLGLGLRPALRPKSCGLGLGLMTQGLGLGLMTQGLGLGLEYFARPRLNFYLEYILKFQMTISLTVH